MIKRYNNLFKFIKEINSLNNCLIVFPASVNEEISMLKSYQYKKLKATMERQKIRIVIERDNYENKRVIKKAI